MITITNDDITVIGSRELQCIQLVLLLKHYLKKDPELLSAAIDFITDDQDESFIDILFHDCYFRHIGGVE